MEQIRTLSSNIPRWVRWYSYVWFGLMGLYLLAWIIRGEADGSAVFYIPGLMTAFEPAGVLMILLVVFALSLATIATALTSDTNWIAAVFTGILVSAFILSIMGPNVFGPVQLYRQLDTLNRGGSTYHLTSHPTSDSEESQLFVLRCDFTGAFCNLVSAPDTPTVNNDTLGSTNLQAISGTIRVINRDDGTTLYTYTP